MQEPLLIPSTTITVSKRTRKALEILKQGGDTFDDDIGALIATHPLRVSWAELAERFSQSDDDLPIEDLIAESKALRTKGR